MNYTKTSTLLAALFAATLTVNAQDLTPGTPLEGLSARASMELLIPGGGRDYYNTGAGLAIGAYYRIPISANVYFEPGIAGYYHSMGGKDPIFIDDHFYTGSAYVSGIRIPLSVGYDFALLDNLTLSMSTGPWLNINLRARQNVSPNLAAPVPVPISNINLFEHGFKRVDGIWGVSLSMIFADHYRVGIDGGIAFTPLASFGVKDKKVKIYGNTVGIYLGYTF